MKKYKFKKEVNSGRYSKVFRGTYTDDKKEKYDIAIKVINKKTLHEHKIDPLTEIEILLTLDSDYIIMLIDFYEDENNFYHILEYVPQDLFSKIGNITYNQCLTIFNEVTKGIQFLHSCNIMHRDIKPENILIDENCKPIICDFGFATKFSKGEKFSDLLGTLFYMAPEIIIDTSYDYRVDIWALGILYFEMLCGYPPFHSENDKETCNKIIDGSIDFPYTFPPKIIKLISLILNINPDYRPSIVEILDDLSLIEEK